jgi:hypothetical protein
VGGGAMQANYWKMKFKKNILEDGTLKISSSIRGFLQDFAAMLTRTTNYSTMVSNNSAVAIDYSTLVSDYSAMASDYFATLFDYIDYDAR